MTHEQAFTQPCIGCLCADAPQLVQCRCVQYELPPPELPFPEKDTISKEGLRHPVEISDKRPDCCLIEVPLRTACRRGRPGEDHVSSGWDVAVQVCRSVPKRYVSLSMHPRDSLIGRSGGSQRRSSTDRTAGKRCPRPVPLRVQIPHVRAYRTGPGGKDEMKACAAMEPAMSVHACSVPFEIDDCADTNLQWNGIA